MANDYFFSNSLFKFYHHKQYDILYSEECTRNLYLFGVGIMSIYHDFPLMNLNQ